MYEKRIKESFHTLKNNPKLFLPDIAYTLMTILVGLLFLAYNNLLGPIISQDIHLITETAKQILNSTPRTISVITTFLISILITLSFGLSFKATKYLLIIKTLKKEKYKLIKTYFEASKTFFFKYLFLKFFLFLIYIIPLIILGLIAYVLEITYIYAIFGILLLIIWLLIRLAFFFHIPALFTEGFNPIKTLRKTYHYCIKNKRHTIFTFLIIIGISAAVGFLVNLFSLGINYVKIPYFTATLLIIFAILKTLVNIATDIWSMIFTFRNYKSK